jgi:hypothetical protein
MTTTATLTGGGQTLTITTTQDAYSDFPGGVEYHKAPGAAGSRGQQHKGPSEKITWEGIVYSVADFLSFRSKFPTIRDSTNATFTWTRKSDTAYNAVAVWIDHGKIVPRKDTQKFVADFVVDMTVRDE